MTRPVLELHAEYPRQMVHAIFSPDTKFVPQRGTWGLQGIIPVPDRPRDYVFFVTFGQTHGHHQFEEAITEDGVLSWQSQPQQSLRDRRIKDFVNHREEIDNIHLFLRTHRKRDYTYLGKLKYLDHDATRECPVHFQWQILEWPLPAEVIHRADIRLTPALPTYSASSSATAPITSHTLTQAKVPAGRTRGAASGGKPSRARRPDYVANQQANQELGMLGELLVLRMEKKRLEDAAHPKLAAQVRHVSLLENDTAGYDILSFETDGSKRFIEVKTTRGSADADFFISASELIFSSVHADRYYLYRLFDYVDSTDSAKYFVVKGDIRNSAHLRLVPTNYKVAIQAEADATGQGVRTATPEPVVSTSKKRRARITNAAANADGRSSDGILET